ncbi:helix-turn-helix domain-containing protein [Kitasatospora sp. NPDC001159]
MVHSTETEAPFPELLRHKRVQAGLTQRTLADLSTISPRTIRDLESGRAHARMQTVRLLADALRLHGLARELFISAGAGRRGRPEGTDPGLAAPRAVNALLGRETEVRAMAEALDSGHRRAVSVSGLPGVGKSRVAAELAARLGSRRGWPVLWIGAGERARDGIGAAFGPLTRSLRLLIESGARDVSAVCRLIGHHEALLVLDGVADAGPPAGVEDLLAYCPGIRVVSTSRVPWPVAGVQPTVLPPLAVPGAEWDATGSPDVLADVPSVRLLVDRLSEVRPGFSPDRADADAVVRICRRLDGLPVALEAAAGRFGVLGLRQLAEEPARGLLVLPVPTRSAGAPGTLGGLLGAEVERLDTAHRAILRELARSDRAPTVPEAAAALDRPRNEVVDGVGLLVGCGLVRASHEESGTRLHLPSLLRTLLRAPLNPRASL